MDRVLASEAKGRGFDSRLAHHFFLYFALLFLAFDVCFAYDYNPESFQDLEDLYSLVNFSLKSEKAPPLFVTQIPEGMEKLKTKKKTILFTKIMLPLILRENRLIREERSNFLEIIEKKEKSEKDKKTLLHYAKKYRVVSRKKRLEEIDFSSPHIELQLLRRIQPVPVAIALGQAALESGWGTSRFVSEGNNIFGHVATRSQKGIKPLRWSGRERYIRKFNSLQESIQKYMLNLNSNRAYRKFRLLRHRFPDDPFILAEGFINYSRIKEVYIQRLKKVILKYRFYRFSDCRLDKEETILPVTNIFSPYLY